MANQPIFIIASERSGTNLLRTLLGNHSDISAPVAPHLLDFFFQKLRYYGHLEMEVNSKQLIRDALNLANHPYHNWQLNTDEHTIYNKYQPNTLIEVVDALYREQASHASKSSYASKGIHNFDYVDLILSRLPNAKFVYLYRDPRDHVASWLRTPLFMHTPYQIISKWNREQDRCLTVAAVHPDKVVKIGYEKLIQNPAQEMTRILNFLSLPVEKSCFETSKRNSESKRNEFWKNLNQPIISDNKQKYKKYLNEKDLLLVESVAKQNMLDLGYTDFETSADLQSYNSVSFKLKELWRKRISKRKNKELFQKKMASLQDKFKLQESIKENIINKHNNDSSNKAVFAST